MTPKKKAIRLFTLMWGRLENGIPREEAKNCALIAVDEILYLLINVYEFDELDNGKVEYWKEVKKEIEKL